MGSVRYDIEMLWRCKACGARTLGRYLACQACGKPKNGDEEYEMPEDCSLDNAVSDPRLLDLAHAGTNWRCSYCGCDQRRFDGSCAYCGASQGEARPEPQAQGPRPQQGFPALSKHGRLALGLAIFFVASFFVVLGFAMLVGARWRSRLPPPPRVSYTAVAMAPTAREVSASVASVQWEHTLTIERYQVLSAQGWAEQKPSDAISPRLVEKRVHHVDKVTCGTTTEQYTATEPDGFSTETYQERVQCGQDCHSLPQTCTQHCTPSKNGFASCTQSCSGGGQQCQPRYCNETRTRQVPKTKTVTKTREVPRYCDKPQYADWYEWKAWGWAPDRSATEQGASLETKWPEPSKLPRKTPLAKGQKEQEQRKAKYQVAFLDAGESRTYEPQSLEEFQRFAPGSQHRFRIDPTGTVSCLD